jgi:hypothetical protein
VYIEKGRELGGAGGDSGDKVVTSLIYKHFFLSPSVTTQRAEW